MSEAPQLESWNPIRLGDVATLITKGTTPNHRGFEYKDNGIIFLKVECISSSGGFVQSRFAYIDQLCHDSLRRSQLQQGDLLYSIAGALGRRAIVNESILPANTNQALAIIRLSADANLDRKYVFHFLVSPQIRNQIERFVVQSAQANISLANVNDFVIDSPPLPEQRKIAEILTTVDSLIERTEALIEKYRRVKQGMMADLLSRGVDAHGKLRPTQRQAPELYKDSEVGWIPNEWQVERLDDVIRIIDCKHYTPNFTKDGFAFIRPRNIKSGGLDWNNLDFVTEGDYRLLTDKHEPSKGDIVFSRNASFGVPCYVDSDRKFAIGQDVVVMTDAKGSARFIYYMLLSDQIESQIHQASTGSTFGRINLKFIRHLSVPVPGREEQQLVAARLDAVDLQMNDECLYLAKLRTLKTGLMQDLLTGKVRVKVDTVEEVAASA